MKAIALIAGSAVLVLCSSCHQFSQRTVEPVPPPGPETLCKPMSPELKAYYTLPAPL